MDVKIFDWDVAEADDLWGIHLIRAQPRGTVNAQIATDVRIMGGVGQPARPQDTDKYVELVSRGFAVPYEMRELVRDVPLNSGHPSCPV